MSIEGGKGKVKRVARQRERHGQRAEVGNQGRRQNEIGDQPFAFSYQQDTRDNGLLTTRLRTDGE
jgi:hypothetical protein